MLGLGSNISKTGKLGVHDLGIVTSDLVLKHNYDLSSVQPLSDGAASFNGTSDYIELGSQSGDLRLSGSNGSIAVWVNPTIVGDDYQRIVDKSDGTDGANGYAFILHDDGTVQCSIDGSTTVAGSIVLTAQKWQHLAWTWDGTNHKLYVDGVLDVSTTGSATPPSDTTNMRIGTWNHSAAREYKGYMCNVGIFEEALSQAQIKSIMNKNYAGLTSSEKTDLVSWWNLDSVITDTTNTVYDNHYGGGEVLGTEKTLDGTFINGLDSWSKSGVTESGGVVRFSGGGTDYVFQSISYTDNKVYAITLEGTGDAKVRVGYSGIAATQTVVGTLPATLNLFVDSTANRIQIYKNSGDELLLTSVSVKEINGNTGTLS